MIGTTASKMGIHTLRYRLSVPRQPEQCKNIIKAIMRLEAFVDAPCNSNLLLSHAQCLHNLWTRCTVETLQHH